jgi:DNA polymerase-3 subunit beta
MNFTVNLNEFQEAVNKTLPAIPPKSTLPVLEHLKFELNDNLLEIISTDQEITIKTQLNVENATSGKVLVPGRKLNDILKALGKTEKITFNSSSAFFKISIVRDGIIISNSSGNLPASVLNVDFTSL